LNNPDLKPSELLNSLDPNKTPVPSSKKIIPPLSFSKTGKLLIMPLPKLVLPFGHSLLTLPLMHFVSNKTL
jgi:hypothetical protein